LGQPLPDGAPRVVVLVIDDEPQRAAIATEVVMALRAPGRARVVEAATMFPSTSLESACSCATSAVAAMSS
jgi:hypothetical protein